MNITFVTDGIGLEKLRADVARLMSEKNPAPGLDTETAFISDF